MKDNSIARILSKYYDIDEMDEQIKTMQEIIDNPETSESEIDMTRRRLKNLKEARELKIVDAI